jgi:hypothetical protein
MIGKVVRLLFKIFWIAFLWVTFLLIFVNLKPELPFEYPAVVSAGAVVGIWAFVWFVVMDN